MANGEEVALRQGIDQDEAIRRVFNDLGKLQADLEEHLRRATFPSLAIITTTAGTPKDFGARVLSPAETAARLGDFQRQGRGKRSLFSKRPFRDPVEFSVRRPGRFAQGN